MRWVRFRCRLGQFPTADDNGTVSAPRAVLRRLEREPEVVNRAQRRRQAALERQRERPAGSRRRSEMT